MQPGIYNWRYATRRKIGFPMEENFSSYSVMMLSLLFSLVSVILTLYVPILIGEAVDCITDSGIDWDGVKHNLLMIVIAMLITAVAQWFMNLINNKIILKF